MSTESTWYVASDSSVLCGVKFYLTDDGFATDIPDRAWCGTAIEARNRCVAANRERAWRDSRINWHYAPIATIGEHRWQRQAKGRGRQAPIAGHIRQ